MEEVGLVNSRALLKILGQITGSASIRELAIKYTALYPPPEPGLNALYVEKRIPFITRKLDIFYVARLADRAEVYVPSSTKSIRMELRYTLTPAGFHFLKPD